jgi:DNA polymerase-3 subunit epsilon
MSGSLVAPGFGQRSFDDLGTPLAEVTFCVVDLETTGSSPADCRITEIGAVKVRGGACLGTFQTLVNPGVAIPPEITVLTGITHAMVLPAPTIDAVLPAFSEFAAGCVLVGHNVRFDAAFLNAALERAGRPRLDHPIVDTCALSRRLLADEVPNHRLGTLASRLRLDHTPSHRALDDALATTDLLHALLERATAFGVLGLDDLLHLPRIAGHPQVAKLRLTDHLPRSPGVYLFVDGRGEVLYVGKATNLRQRVRSYFSGDTRRKVGGLLREAQGVRHVACRSTLEAAVTEVRLIHEHEPRYNRVGKSWNRYTYLELTLHERFPRLGLVRTPRPGSVHLGPLAPGTARLAAEAILTAAPLRRCTTRLPAKGGPPRATPCTPAQLGVAPCPCAGTITEAAYRPTVERVVAGLTRDPALLLGPLQERMDALAAHARYEEAADVRDRAAALSSALRRQRRLDGLRAAGTVELRLPDGGLAEVRAGVLVRTDADGTLPLDAEPAAALGPLPRHLADEVACVAAWLDAEAGRVRVERCDGVLASPVQRLPTFEPAAARR